MLLLIPSRVYVQSFMMIDWVVFAWWCNKQTDFRIYNTSEICQNKLSQFVLSLFSRQTHCIPPRPLPGQRIAIPLIRRRLRAAAVAIYKKCAASARARRGWTSPSSPPATAPGPCATYTSPACSCGSRVPTHVAASSANSTSSCTKRSNPSGRYPFSFSLKYFLFKDFPFMIFLSYLFIFFCNFLLAV